jgi:DNA-directed RNA polymerase beta' subunit
MTLRELEKVLYFESYVVIDPEMPFKERGAGSEEKYLKLRKEQEKVLSSVWRRSYSCPAQEIDLEKLSDSCGQK